jgi:hypothetical protein
VIFLQDHKSPLTLTAGVLTPALLRTFHFGSLQYFSQKSIAPDKHVSSVVWGLCDPRIQNWYMNDMARIDKLSIMDFMAEVHSNWLSDGGEGYVEQGILNVPQGDTPFWDWLQTIQSTNALIVGTYTEMDDAVLHTHIKAKMNEALKEAAHHNKAHLELDFKKWTSRLQELDEERVNDERKLRELMAKERATHLETRHDNTHPLYNPSRTGNTSHNTRNHNTSSNSGASTSTAPRLPPLTQIERGLLAANKGCFKCCLPFVDHRSLNCPNPYPTIENYKTITESTIAAAKNRTQKTIAAVAPAMTSGTQAPVAVVMPNLQLCVLGNGSDSEYVAPLHTPH